MDCVAFSTRTTDDTTVLRSAFVYAQTHASSKKAYSREVCTLVGTGLQFHRGRWKCVKKDVKGLMLLRSAHLLLESIHSLHATLPLF